MPPIGKSTQPPRGPGGRVRVTNRSRLRIYHGSIDADNVVLEEDGSGKGMSTAGVDAEDANVSTTSCLEPVAEGANFAFNVELSDWLGACRDLFP